MCIDEFHLSTGITVRINRTHRSSRLRLRYKSDLWSAARLALPDTVALVDPPSRAICARVWAACCITCTTLFAHPLISLPNEHGSMPLTGAAASRLEPSCPLLSFPDWYNLRVCLILQEPSVRTACFQKTLPHHCKAISDPCTVDILKYQRPANIYQFVDALLTQAIFCHHLLRLYLFSTGSLSRNPPSPIS